VESNAQVMPIPPPAPGTINGNNEENVKDDNTPPSVEFLTDELKEGKNVLKVKVTDESLIELKEVRYVRDGMIRSTDLVKDQNNIYKALITVKVPSAIVEIKVGDEYGNKENVAKSFTVIPQPDLFSFLWKLLKNP
jgi:hypothetical protein